MAIFSGWAILALVLAVLVFAGLIVLQVYLSKLGQIGWGLILPIVSFLFAVILSIPNFWQTFAESFSLGAFFASVIAFAVYNVSTLAFALVFATQRRKINRNRQMKTMHIQDM